ncbi:MAG: hypothetical protein HY898_02730 [Deltaproteobacteria bacterium]|nr:hypothetical protein [Deltaproteobacteria bacterium]
MIGDTPRMRWIPGLALALAMTSAACGARTGLLEPDDAALDGGSEAGAPDRTIRQLSGGYSHGCALRRGGQVLCWGMNNQGQIGDGTTQDRPTAVYVAGVNDATRISSGHAFNCAVRSSGKVSCWGARPRPSGESSIQASPVEVDGLERAVDVAVGSNHTCALSDDGKVHCWGMGLNGQLGVGIVPFADMPVVVQGISGATQVIAGTGYSCAVLADNTIACWGSNVDHAAGGPIASEPVLVPTKVKGTEGARQASSRSSHACLVSTDGAVRCWGGNFSKKLGFETTWCCSPDAQVVKEVTGAREVAAGDAHSCARTESGEVWCWGLGMTGELGNGKTPDSSLAVQVVGLSGARHVALGAYHSCAIDASDQVWCWGDNRGMQLGGATSEDKSTVPVKVPIPK